MDTRCIEELQTRKPLSAIWASSSISRKRQATGFEPLRHIYVGIVYNPVFKSSSSTLMKTFKMKTNVLEMTKITTQEAKTPLFFNIVSKELPCQTLTVFIHMNLHI